MRGITGITAPLYTFWTLFFTTSRLHHVAASTGNPSYFPQVRTILSRPRPASRCSTRFRISSSLTGILRGQQFRYPSPVLYFFFFLEGCSSTVLTRNTEQCETLHIKWQRGSASQGWVQSRFMRGDLIDGYSQAEPYRTLLPANLHLVRLVT